MKLKTMAEQFTRGELRQILYCLECMYTDYEDGTNEELDYSKAIERASRILNRLEAESR